MVIRTTPRVVAPYDSLRDENRTRVATNVALTAAVEAGATTELVDYAGVTHYPELNQHSPGQSTDCEAAK